MFKIVKDNQPSLRIRSEPVPFPIEQKYFDLLNKMLDYLKKSQDDEYASKHHLRAGVGLAAPQIGINLQIIAIYYEKEENEFVEYALINPRIVSSTVKQCYLKNGEGCLSVDEDHKGYVYRYYKIRVKAYDALKKEEVEITARGYDAIVLQHEIDHLSGILYYDHIDKLDPFRQKENAIAI